MHTPGPWTIYEGTHVMSGNRLVANTGGYQSNFADDLTMNKANARLIAAAPELLEALEAIAKHDGVDHFIAKHLVGIATEAIRKAKGANRC